MIPDLGNAKRRGPAWRAPATWLTDLNFAVCWLELRCHGRVRLALPDLRYPLHSQSVRRVAIGGLRPRPGAHTKPPFMAPRSRSRREGRHERLYKRSPSEPVADMLLAATDVVLTMLVTSGIPSARLYNGQIVPGWWLITRRSDSRRAWRIYDAIAITSVPK
jgi:hypothetical protein